MQTELSKADQGAAQKHTTSSLGVVIALLIFAAIYFTTVTEQTGDTPVYSGDLIHFADGLIPAGALWEFGHLIWRPVGYVVWQTTKPLTAAHFNSNPMLEIAFALFLISFIAGVALTLLSYLISRRLGLNTPQSLVITTGILLTSAVVNFLHSGCAYVTGVTLVFAGTWFILRALQDRHMLLNSICAAAALALSFSVWFPYFFSIPAALTLCLVVAPWSPGAREIPQQKRVLVLISTTLGIAVFGGIIFLTGAAMNHVGSVSQFISWGVNSGHGVHQNRRALRFPTGITRTFFFLGDEGTTLKRFAFGDPYAPVHLVDLFGAGLWKVIVVFATFLAVCWSLVFTTYGRKALLVTLAGIFPTVAFAIFIFEPGSAERYLPLYAALLVGIGAVLLQRHARYARITLLIFLVTMAAVNIKAYVVTTREIAHASSERVTLVHDHTLHGGVALILSFNDPLSTYFQRVPFDSRNQPGALPLFHVADVVTGQWKTESACRIQQAWDAGGDAWLSKRFLVSRPLPDWEWVEHDNPQMHWSDLRQFFSNFDTSANIGSDDGFVEIARDAKDESLVSATCAK